MRKLFFSFILVVALALVATPVLAQGTDGDVVIWGSDYTLGSGERVKGDLVVYGGSVSLKGESQVDGDVTVFGGSLTISGEVKGDVTVWGGNVQITSDATVRGKVVAVGGNVNREEGADVRGGEVEGWPVPSIPSPPATPRVPVPPDLPRVQTAHSWGNDLLRGIGSIFRSVFGITVMVVLGILVVVFLPKHTETVAETMIKMPVQSFASGLAALVAGTIVLVILALIATVLVATICLAPIGLALFLPMVVAGIAIVFGWIAAGLLLGVKILRALTHKEPNQVVAVAIGVLVLSLLSMTPCVGWLAALIAVTWSLGAVVYSLFGTRSEHAPTPTAGTPHHDPRMDQL
jgi:hypothetical protein